MRYWEDEDPKYVRLVIDGQDLAAVNPIHFSFGPIKTDTSVLGSHGWRLDVRQRTPLHVSRTRPKVSIYPVGAPEAGFKWKLRARARWTSEEHVLNDLRHELGASSTKEFSLTKFETKRIPDVERVAELREKFSEYYETKAELTSVQKILAEERRRLAATMTENSEVKRQLADMIRHERRMIESDSEDELRARISALESQIRELREDPFGLLSEWTSREAERQRREKIVCLPDNVIEMIDFIDVKPSDVNDRIEKALAS